MESSSTLPVLESHKAQSPFETVLQLQLLQYWTVSLPQFLCAQLLNPNIVAMFLALPVRQLSVSVMTHDHQVYN